MTTKTMAETTRGAELIESIIVEYFSQSLRQAAMVSPAYLRLWKETYRMVKSGGKRLRPHMVCLGYRAFGGTDLERIAPVAAAVELLHVSMLIHDDIIDRDLVRRGADNLTAGYLKHYAGYIRSDRERRHYAESAALLAGDLLLSGAHQMIAATDVDAGLKLAVQNIFSRSVFEVVGGELIDTEAAFVDTKDIRPLAVARYKTAGYSFISPLLIGTTLAGAGADQKEAVRQFAEQLGIAFQLQDDILGIFGDSNTTGKSTTGDIREGKRTYLIECFERAATPDQLQEFETIYGNPGLTVSQADVVRELLVASGARSQVELEITRLQGQAITALAATGLSSDYHEEFIQLIDKSLKRQK